MDEAELIRQAQNGGKQALSELIVFYYPYVSKFLLGLSRDEQLTQDLTQETFVRLIRGIERFDSSGSARFSTYVLTIAKRLYIDYLRRERHVFVDYEAQEHLPDGCNVEETALSRLEAQRAFDLLSTLPEPQAQAIRLKYLEQMTLEEIALRLGTGTGTVKSRIHNGMMKLRGKMTEGGFRVE